jgi:hypothetical protein
LATNGVVTKGVVMTEFEWPHPTTLSDEELEIVLVQLRATARKAMRVILDEPTKYVAALADAQLRFVQEQLDARQGEITERHFDDIEPEDFAD